MNLPSESESDENENEGLWEAILKTRQKPEPFTLRFLGQGSYNCILEYTDFESKSWALRVAILPQLEKKGAFLKRFRARAILQWMQDFKNVFGPSILYVERPFQTLPTLFEMAKNLGVNVDDLWNILCAPLKKAKHTFKTEGIPYEWSIEKQELLISYRSSKRTILELVKDTFCLLWYFMTLGSPRLGFRHRDFKTDNLLLRKYDQSKAFRFESKKYGTFEFLTDSVPVVIDFDFATLNSSNKTKPNARFIVGTWNYAPPEAFIFNLYKPLLRKAMKSTHSSNPFADLEQVFGQPYIKWITSDRSFQGADGYDQWAVGLILLKKLCHLKSIKLLDLENNPMISKFAEIFELSIITFLDFSEKQVDDLFSSDTRFLQHFFINTLLICAVRNESWENPFKNVPDFYPRWLLHDNVDLFRAAMRNREFINFQQGLKKKAFSNFFPLLRQLFAWNPDIRLRTSWLDKMDDLLVYRRISSNTEIFMTMKEKGVDEIQLPDIE